ncbi:MAG: hypothetical protein J6U74_02010 [Clostridia bacterium]|nr:hypothetical protein [Clostridia bacterium]
MTGKPEEIVKWLFGQDREKVFEIKEYKEKRSLNANALLWKCLGEIASALRSDKWEVYLQMLKRYGTYTYICVKPKVVEAVKKQWRECEEIGHINIDGQEAVQLLCYFGSSTMNTKEFSRLLDGVISEMREMGLDTPDKDLERVIKQLEAEHDKEDTGQAH